MVRLCVHVCKSQARSFALTHARTHAQILKHFCNTYEYEQGTFIGMEGRILKL
jgi:hypothetical protein